MTAQRQINNGDSESVDSGEAFQDIVRRVASGAALNYRAAFGIAQLHQRGNECAYMFTGQNEHITRVFAVLEALTTKSLVNFHIVFSLLYVNQYKFPTFASSDRLKEITHYLYTNQFRDAAYHAVLMGLLLGKPYGRATKYSRLALRMCWSSVGTVPAICSIFKNEKPAPTQGRSGFFIVNLPARQYYAEPYNS